MAPFSVIFLPPASNFPLKIQRDLSRKRPRRYIMRAAEGGKKVVESILVGDIDGRHVEVNLVAISAEEVVLADGGVKQVAGCDARRVLVVVLRARSWNGHQR